MLLAFGTGWGLAPEVIEHADALLEPIRAARGDYNHLSVRSACAIALPFRNEGMNTMDWNRHRRRRRSYHYHRTRRGRRGDRYGY